MELISSVNWIFCLATAVTLLVFLLINYISPRINWTLVILISFFLGGAVGLIFSPLDSGCLRAAELLGNIYVNAVTLLVAPVILVSVLFNAITLLNRDNLKKMGTASILWLLISAILAILLSIAAGSALGIGRTPSPVFQAVEGGGNFSASAYAGTQVSFYDLLLGLFPSNLIRDIADSNIPAVIIIAAAIAGAYLVIAKEEGESQLSAFGDLICALKKLLGRIFAFLIDLTPHGVFCLAAGSANYIFTDLSVMVQLLLLVAAIYGVCLIHTFVINGVLLKLAAKLDPIRFFKKIAPAQAAAFKTQSSAGTLPISIDCLKTKVGIDGEAADFTSALGIKVGMPGCTCVWPILLAMFFANAAGLSWGASDYAALAVLALFLPLGCAGVPGIAAVSAIALFRMLGLPVAAVVLLTPVNTLSDPIRTTDNITSAAVVTAIVARREGRLRDDIFNQAEP